MSYGILQVSQVLRRLASSSVSCRQLILLDHVGRDASAGGQLDAVGLCHARTALESTLPGGLFTPVALPRSRLLRRPPTRWPCSTNGASAGSNFSTFAGPRSM